MQRALVNIFFFVYFLGIFSVLMSVLLFIFMLLLAVSLGRITLGHFIKLLFILPSPSGVVFYFILFFIFYFQYFQSPVGLMACGELTYGC